MLRQADAHWQTMTASSLTTCKYAHTVNKTMYIYMNLERVEPIPKFPEPLNTSIKGFFSKANKSTIKKEKYVINKSIYHLAKLLYNPKSYVNCQNSDTHYNRKNIHFLTLSVTSWITNIVCIGSTRKEIVIIIGSRLSNSNSNPEQGSLHFP